MCGMDRPSGGAEFSDNAKQRAWEVRWGNSAQYARTLQGHAYASFARTERERFEQEWQKENGNE